MFINCSFYWQTVTVWQKYTLQFWLTKLWTIFSLKKNSSCWSISLDQFFVVFHCGCTSWLKGTHLSCCSALFSLRNNYAPQVSLRLHLAPVFYSGIPSLLQAASVEKCDTPGVCCCWSKYDGQKGSFYLPSWECYLSIGCLHRW